MMAVWFLFGLLCGAAAGVAVCLLSRRQTTAVVRADKGSANTHKAWVQTRNFLYYDGTQMPVIKEEE